MLLRNGSTLADLGNLALLGGTPKDTAAQDLARNCEFFQAAAEKGWLDLRSARDESLLAIRRAGADVILTYFAEAYARDYASRA